MRTVRLGAGVAAVALTAACTSLPAPTPSGGCPGGWDVGVVWSSQTAPASEIEFLSGETHVGRRTLAYQGLEAAPAGAPVVSGADVWLVANGNADRDKSTVLRYSTLTCAATPFAVPEQLVLAVAAGTDFFVTSNTANGAAEVRRRTASGTLTAETKVPGAMLTRLVVGSGVVYALGSDMESGGSILIEFDPATLAALRRVELAGTSDAVFAAVLRGDALYFPRTVSREGAEGTELGKVGVGSLAQSAVALGRPAPLLMVEGGDALFIGHPFINPGFRPMSDYRSVSRYQPATGAVDAVDTGVGIQAMAWADGVLYVLGTGASGDTLLVARDASTLAPLWSTPVTSPGDGHHYVAALIASAAG